MGDRGLGSGFFFGRTDRRLPGQLYRFQCNQLDVGHQHDAQPGHIVGAIANEAEIDSCYIGNIDIHEDFTLIDLPDGMPGEIFKILKKARVSGRPLNIKAVSQQVQDENKPRKRGPAKPKQRKRKAKRPAVARRKQQSSN